MHFVMFILFQVRYTKQATFYHRILAIVCNVFALMAQHRMTHHASPVVLIIVRHWCCQICLMPRVTKPQVAKKIYKLRKIFNKQNSCICMSTKQKPQQNFIHIFVTLVQNAVPTHTSNNISCFSFVQFQNIVPGNNR